MKKSEIKKLLMDYDIEIATGEIEAKFYEYKSIRIWRILFWTLVGILTGMITETFIINL